VEQRPESREVSTQYKAGLRWLPVEFSVTRTITKRWQRRGSQYAEAVAEIAGVTDAELQERVEQHELFGDTFIAGGEKAVRTGDADFRTVLARTVAAGMGDDAKVDEAAYYTSLLVQLEPVHLRVLAATQRAEKALSAAGKTGNPTVEFVAKVAGVPAVIVSSASERLHSLSLLTDRLRGDMIDWSRIPLGAFGLTDAGHAVLANCDELLSDEAP
jgi:hypothetical protein